MSDQTVFVVDDDPSARRGLVRLVRAAGMKAESFASAADFLASGRCDGPGCIVLDVRMPDMTGPELQEELGKAEYGMPIIFLSAHGDVPTAAQAMKRGAVDFLTKPVERDSLLGAIRVSLARDAENRAQRAESSSFQEQIETLTPRRNMQRCLIHIETHSEKGKRDTGRAYKFFGMKVIPAKKECRVLFCAYK